MKYTIAIDGPAASGKSSTAEEVAKRLGFQRIDSGLLYRAITYVLLRDFGSTDLEFYSDRIKNFIENLEITQAKSRTFVNQKDVSEHLKTIEIDSNVGKVAREAYIRHKVLGIQREAVNHTENGIVIDGRDIGTVVLPDAFLKIFITAKDTTRARRRNIQGGDDYDAVLKELRKRDYDDINREHGPLKVAEDAIVIENDEMTKEMVVNRIVEIFNERRNK